MCTKNIQTPSQGYGKLNNSKWLKILRFTTLLEGGMRGDLIETFKILKEVRTYLREDRTYFYNIKLNKNSNGTSN